MARRTARYRITSKEKMELINPKNLRLKDDFLMYLKSIQRAEGTINGYKSDLNILFTYILDYLDNKDFAKLTKRDIIGMQNWMVEHGMSSARIRRFKACLSSLSNFCEALLAEDDPEFEGYRSVVKKIGNPPLVPAREKVVWVEDELGKLLDNLTDRGEYEKACYVALAMYGGRRKSEIARFRVSDFTPDRVVCNGALYKSAPILTKGNKYLECYTLKKRFDPYLKRWLRQREEIGLESEWLFPSRSNPRAHIETSRLNSWARTFSKITGKDWYAHSLRHYFVSELSRAGIPDGVVVEIMGWSSSEMFKVYDDNPKDDKIAMYFSDGEIDTSRVGRIDNL